MCKSELDDIHPMAWTVARCRVELSIYWKAWDPVLGSTYTIMVIVMPSRHLPML